MIDAFTYGFVQRGLIVGVITAVLCALLGVFLVLRRYSLIGDGIAHISFGGISFGLLFNISPFFSALAFSLIGSYGIMRIRERIRYGDVAIAIMSYTGLGLGIFIISLHRGLNADILSYLFGSILTISLTELVTAAILLVVVAAFVIYFYRDLIAMSFDEQMAKTQGVKTGLLNTILVALTAVTVVASMRVVGLLLAASLLTIPAASALQISRSFRQSLLISAVIGVVSVVLGIFLSVVLDTATSGTIVLLNFIIFIAISLMKRLGFTSTKA